MYSKQLVLIFTLTMFSAVITYADSGSSNAPMADVNFLQKLHTTADVEARSDLVRTLEQKPSESTRLTLETIALDTKEAGGVRMQAICSLGNVATHQSVQVLLDLLESDIQQRRGFWACAIPVLAGLKDRRAIPLLTRIANLREDHLAGMDHMAIEALAEIGDEREASLLASKAYIVAVRLAVIKGLARIASVKSTDILIEGLQGAEEPEIVKAAQSGILKIGKAAIPILENTLTESPEGWDEKYRTRIQELILKIQQ